jgi:hypothetical protein
VTRLPRIGGDGPMNCSASARRADASAVSIRGERARARSVAGRQRGALQRPEPDQHRHEKIAAVTAADVQRVAARYLQTTNRVVVHTAAAARRRRPLARRRPHMKTLRLLAILLLASARGRAGRPAAQQPTDFKGVVLKNKAPVSNDVLRVTFRRPFEAKLKNGMDCWCSKSTVADDSGGDRGAGVHALRPEGVRSARR